MRLFTIYRARTTYIAVSVAVLLCLGATMAHYLNPSYGMPYHDKFDTGKADEWHAFGGAWEINQGNMRNDSDERGAKLLTGSPRWRNYVLQSDVRFSVHGGDVGLIVRSNDEELGVDAYDGYYIGLRSGDNSLVIGRADHGWMEGQPVLMPEVVRAPNWYQLKVVVYGCRVGASARNLLTNSIVYAALEEHPCVPSGRIGLRSIATGGEWRNLEVSRATPSDLAEICRHATRVSSPSFPRGEAAYNEKRSFPTYDENHRSGPRSFADPGTVPRTIDNLSSLKEEAKPALVRGVVVLTSPTLYVQDATGGASVQALNAPLLNLGDEVEIAGRSEPLGYSSAISDASVKLLWDRAPVPPVSVTAAQAATGAFDAMFIETQGFLASVTTDADTVTFELNDGMQSFRAIVSEAHKDSIYRRIAPRSLVRVRGICVLDPRYTHRMTPFALLLRSTSDIDVIVGPPWWTARRLAQIGVSVLAALLLAYIFYSRIEGWKQRGIAQARDELAYELHDTLAQSFAGLGFQLQGIRNGLRTTPAVNLGALDAQLDVACGIVSRAHQEASACITMLHGDLSEGSDLAGAFERLVAMIVSGESVAFNVQSIGEARELPIRVSDALFHIGREAIVNAVTHANPTEIIITIRYEPPVAILVVGDDGSGFQRSSIERGLGLRSMERRAAGIKAKIAIASTPSHGTRVEVTAPLARRKDYIAYFASLWRAEAR